MIRWRQCCSQSNGVFAPSLALKTDEAVGHGRSLLVRPTNEALATRVSVQLDRIATDQDWSDYEQRRVLVEHGFGIGEPEARRMVHQLREQTSPGDDCRRLTSSPAGAVTAMATPCLQRCSRCWSSTVARVLWWAPTRTTEH